nr:hypothetical protein [Acinetobacter bereziniae]
MIYKGSMYERIAKSQYIFILTDGLAEFLKKYDLAKSMKLLGLLIKIITRFRCALGLQKNMSIQYSIKEIAIGLNKTDQEILTACSYLKELLGEKKRVPLLNWVRTPKQELNTLSIKELCEKFNLTMGAVMYRRKLLKGNET